MFQGSHIKAGEARYLVGVKIGCGGRDGHCSRHGVGCCSGVVTDAICGSLVSCAPHVLPQASQAVLPVPPTAVPPVLVIESTTCQRFKPCNSCWIVRKPALTPLQ